MSEVDAVPTTALHPTLEAASQVLAGVLVARPDVDTTVSVSEAILILGDVSPPLPPLDYPEVGIDVHEGITTALEGLPSETDEGELAQAVARAIPEGTEMLGFSPEAIAIAVRRALA